MEEKETRMLYIEDDPGFARLLQKKMEQKGYSVEIAGDGKEGLEKFARSVYDIVLVDYALPDIDGLQLVRTLVSTKPSVPVFMITAFGNEEIAVQALQLGAQDYLVKDTKSNFIDLLPSRVEKALLQAQLISQKQEAESARKVSEQKLRSILTSLDDFVFVIDGNKKIVDMHKPVSLEGKFLSFDDCVGKPVKSCFPDEVARMLIDAIDTIQETGLVVQLDYSMEFDDEHRWFNAKVSEYNIGKGFSGVIVLARDITVRRTMEQDLEESRNRLKILFDFAPDGYFLLDFKGVIWEANQALERILGYNKEELLGKNVAELPVLPVSIAQTVNAFFTDWQFESDSGSMEIVINRRDGSSAILEVCTYPVKTQNRTMLMGSARDITARKEAEAQVRYQQDLLAQVFAATPNSLVMKDVNFRYKFVNQAFCDYVGRAEADIIGKTDFDLFPKEEAEYYRQGDLLVLKTRKTLMQQESVTRDGNQLHFAVSRNPLCDNNGEPVGLVVSLNDVSELLRSAEELQEAKREAEAANKAKSQFLANISHELRTPLTAIIGFSDIIEERLAGELTEKQERYVLAIKESGKHLLELINDILDISKVEFGAMQLDISVFNLGALVHRCINMLRTKAEQQGVRIKATVPSTISALRIEADERKLKQVLFNLLSNAVKFTPKNGEITVGARINDHHLMIYVRDTGIGIPKQEQMKIFDEFYQVKQSVKYQRRGTGLGLSLTKRLIELHGGIIRVRSKGLGKGSRFICELPVDRIVLGD